MTQKRKTTKADAVEQPIEALAVSEKSSTTAVTEDTVSTEATDGEAVKTDEDDAARDELDDAPSDVSETEERAQDDVDAAKDPMADVAAEAPVPVTASARSGTSAGVLLIGLIGAGAVGGLVAQYANKAWPFDQFLTPVETVAYAPLAQVEALSTRLDGMALRADVPAKSEITALSDKLGTLEAQIADLSKQVAQNAAQQEGPSVEDITQMQAEFERLSAALGSVEDIVNAQEELRQARLLADQSSQARIALAQALETGASFAPIVTELSNLGIEVPAVLMEAAQTGVPTRSSLAGEFPDIARAALAADRSEASKSPSGGGLGDFFKNQLGLRSVAPKDGDSTDAILSRVEANMRGGDLEKALAEAQGLSEKASAIVTPWATKVQTRLQIEAAFETLNTVQQ